jgi:hypothetical protein
MARGDWAAAWTAIEEHRRRYPNGQLAEEREALRVETLAAMGRSDEARGAARAFAERFPESVLLARVHRARVVP